MGAGRVPGGPADVELHATRLTTRAVIRCAATATRSAALPVAGSSAELLCHRPRVEEPLVAGDEAVAQLEEVDSLGVETAARGGEPLGSSDPSIVPVIRQRQAIRPASMEHSGASAHVSSMSGNAPHIDSRYRRTATEPRSRPSVSGSSHATSGAQSANTSSGRRLFQAVCQRPANSRASSAVIAWLA